MTPRRFLPGLLLLFVGSGCAALIYEVVWFQLLELVIGASALSLGVLLATFMGGMCLGSLLLARFVPARMHPLRVYAVLEVAIAACALLILFGMPLGNTLYAHLAGGGVTGIIVRAVFAAICLLPPTLLMGATLPAISRWVEATPEGVAWLGFFYGGNIAGGVLGSLLAGFYLLRVYDLPTTTYVAVLIDVVVAALALALARHTPVVETLSSDDRPAPAPPPGAWAVYVSIAFSGATALASEGIWTRILSLLFGATVYTFALILAVFLFGLGIGSSIGAAMGRSLRRPRLALGWCQMLLCAAIAWTAWMLTESLP
jgi:spermidine synthase